MIRAVFFDVGGVLKSGYRNACEQFARKIGNSIEEYELFEEQYFPELETGTLSRRAFFSLLSKRFSFSIEDLEKEWKKAYLETFIENTETRTFALNLKPKYIVGIISDVTTLIIDYNYEKGVYEGFDPVILSAETGFVKPQREIFDEANKRSKTTPAECIFIDDKPPLIEKAREYGFHGILYQNPTQLREEFNKIITFS